jgi:hypothetical protein
MLSHTQLLGQSGASLAQMVHQFSDKLHARKFQQLSPFLDPAVKRHSDLPRRCERLGIFECNGNIPIWCAFTASSMRVGSIYETLARSFEGTFTRYALARLLAQLAISNADPIAA